MTVIGLGANVARNQGETKLSLDWESNTEKGVNLKDRSVLGLPRAFC